MRPIVNLPEYDRATGIGNMHKIFGKDRACGSGDILSDGQTDKQTDTQTDSQRDKTDSSKYFATAPAGEIITVRYKVVMLSSVASDMVFSYKTLHLLRNLLFVDMFGILSLLALFILHAVY